MRLAGTGPERLHDRQQRLAEGLERLLGVPDVEHLNLPVGLHGDVVEPAAGAPAPAASSWLTASSYFSGVNPLGVK
jgi:hypothetical protein